MINKAKEFAQRIHANQIFPPTGRPVLEHLRLVDEILADFDYQEEWRVAGWLCHVLEAGVPRIQLKEEFGEWVASIVDACTGVGLTQDMRNRRMYNKIAMLRQAAVIKMADRMATVEQCKVGFPEWNVLLSEWDEFEHHVGVYVSHKMRDRINKAYELRLSITGS